ncbi:MAG: AMP-binding protein [Polyangiaceae bacterium]|nr:AMP-binding protein [Polyangiaceae bacterium]
MSRVDPTDEERYPLLSDAGRRTLQRLREHANAPIFRNQSGNRLTAEDLERVVTFEQETRDAWPRWREGEEPAWISSFVAHALETVPHYKGYGREPGSALTTLPTISRADLSLDIARFVPDDVAIDRLIHFTTSGTTGHPLMVASHPTVAASYLALHKKALRHFGVELRAGAGEVGVVLVGFQHKTFTYVSVTPQMGEAGLAKINLVLDDWNDPADREKYLDALDPEMYSGDPVSFTELLSLPLGTKPRALLSTGMTLLPQLRATLEKRFGCPVVDVYSLNEAGPIAFADGEVWRLLQHRMYVEILDEEGRRAAPGELGEVTLSGGFNDWLPLVRYRTGDFARMVFHGNEPRLTELSGRAPVRFVATNGAWLNNIEVTHALGRFALGQWTLLQRKDKSFELRSRGGNADELRDALRALFGKGAVIDVDTAATFDGKVKQYTSELGTTT